MSATIVGTTFDQHEYDERGDVLYLSVGRPQEAVRTIATPEGHAVPGEELRLPADVLPNWHQRIFRANHPEVGRVRTGNDPRVGFAVPVFDEAVDRLTLLAVPVSPPTEIPKRLARGRFG